MGAQGGCGKLRRAVGGIFAFMFYLFSVLRLSTVFNIVSF